MSKLLIPFRLALLLAATAALSGEAAVTVGDDDPIPEEALGAVVVDRAKGEARVPCRFVNPSRQIEVFACHRTGPTHETVVEFDAGGAELYRALIAIGCRPAEYWNATSGSDILRHQGDRVLVWVRWRSGARVRELPAEALLVDGDTGFPSFVRGFSFRARAAPGSAAEAKPRDGEDEPESSGGEPASPPAAGAGADSAGDAGAADLPAIPAAVEISLGATRRQQAIFSLLSHPTSLDGSPGVPGGEPTRSLVQWAFPPLVNEAVLPDLASLAAQRSVATLILRRIASEKELTVVAARVAGERGLEDRARFIASLSALAAGIDRTKARYEAIGDRVRAVVARFEGGTDDVPATAADDLRHLAELLRLRGRALSSRAQELYFTLYLRQARYRLAWLRQRADRLPDPSVLEEAVTLTEDGLAFEVPIAERERRRRELAIGDFIFAEELRSLELERDERLLLARGRDVERRIAELRPDDDYVRELLSEDLARERNAREIVQWRRRFAETILAEARAAREDLALALPAPVAGKRARAEAGLRLARLREKLLGLRESIRWERDDLEADDPVTRAKAQEALEGLEPKRKALEEEIRAREAELGSAATETPAGE